MALRSFRLAISGVRFRGAPDGSCLLEFDDSILPQVVQALYKGCTDVQTAPVAAGASNPQARPAIQPPVGHVPPGVKPPPSPHTIFSGQAGQAPSGAPVPGAPVLPQPGILAPPPPPTGMDLRPAPAPSAPQSPGAVLGSIFPVPRQRPRVGGQRPQQPPAVSLPSSAQQSAPQPGSVQGIQQPSAGAVQGIQEQSAGRESFDPNKKYATKEIVFERGPNGEQVAVAKGPAPVLPQPAILAPPRPGPDGRPPGAPPAPSQLLGPDGRRLA